MKRTIWTALGLCLTTFACSDDDAAKTATGDAGPGDAAVAPGPALAYSAPDAVGPYTPGVTQFTVPHTSVAGEARDLDVSVWYPSRAASPRGTAITDAEPARDDGPFAFIALSHGSGGDPLAYKFATTFLATHGFVVATMPHPGNRLSDCGFTCSPAALAESYDNRPGDVLATVDAVLAESATAGSVLSDLVDPARLGVMGHSFGGQTALRLMARDETPFLSGLAAAPAPALFATSSPPEDYVAQISRPLMFQAADTDELVAFSSVTASFDDVATRTDAVLLTLVGGGHFNFNDTCVSNCGFDQDTAHAIANTYAVAFFKHYLESRSDYDEFLVPNADIEGGRAKLEVGTRP